jgi:DNA ligase-1
MVLMLLDKIYKKDVSGNTRVWQAEVGEGEWEGCWRSHYGTLGGQIITTEWTEVELKSQSTISNQALFYARAEMNKKLRIDYRLDIEEINQSRMSFIKPMLAQTYVGWQRPCFAQPKLDGVRCLANIDGLWTRTNKQIISTPHIEGELKAFFEDYPNIILDGELYNHDLNDNFNKIISLARKTKPEFADLEESAELIEYWIYDMFDLENPGAIFEERWDFLREKLFELDHNINMTKATPTKFVTTEDELDIYNQELLLDGFEGQIVRHNVRYQQKRTHELLKRKEFVDEEYELKSIEEGAGQWSGYAKIAVCSLPDGREFRAGVSGTQAFTLQLLMERAKYHSVTVKYQALTPDGIPRFPIAIKFWEEMFDRLDEVIKPKRDLFA